MNAPKSFKEFKAQQKAKKNLISKVPIDKLIWDLKLNPNEFLSNYKNELPIIISKSTQLKNFQDENLITLFINECETNPDLKNDYKDFMQLASKGFLTLNKNKETFLFELSRRNNLKLFLETIINLDNLNLLNDELLVAENINSENCFSYIIKLISTTANENFMLKKEYNNLIEKVLKLIFEKYKVFNNLAPLEKFNVFNYFMKIKIAEKNLKDLTKDDALKDFDIIFSNEENFNLCKIILFDKQLNLNLLISFMELGKYDLTDIFIQKYTENKFCHYPELFLNFMFNLLTFENYKINMDWLHKIFPIILKENISENKLVNNLGDNIYHLIFSNQKLSQKEKNLLFSYLNEKLLINDDLNKTLLSKENKEGYPPLIVYLLNTDLDEKEEKFFKENILEKTIINNKNNKNSFKYQYTYALLDLLGIDKIKRFLTLLEFLQKYKLINFFPNKGDTTCFLNEIISRKVENDIIIEKIINFIIKNFDLVNSFENLKYLIKFLKQYFKYIKKEEFQQSVILIKDKFIPHIKNEEEQFLQKINKLDKIEYKIIDSSLFLFKSKYNEFYKSISDIINEIWFNHDYNIIETKDILMLFLDLIGVYKYNDLILDICFSSEKFKPELVDIFIEKYYSKFNLMENKQLQYFSLFNFQNSFYNNKLKNNNYIYFYLRFIKGISNLNTKIFYQCMIFSILKSYKYESYLPLFFTEQELKEIDNNKELFIKPKLLNDDIKLILLASLLDYEIYKNFYDKFICKVDPSNAYSVIDRVNSKFDNEVRFEFQFNNNIEKNSQYKKVCNLLSKHHILKYYICFFNCIIKKGKVFKFQDYCMKEIFKIIQDENEFIEIANYQLTEFIKYHDLLKQNNLNIGIENDGIKNENNIFGLNILYLSFIKMIENNFNDKSLIIGEMDISKEILYFKNLYLKEFNITPNEEQEQIFEDKSKVFDDSDFVFNERLGFAILNRSNKKKEIDNTNNININLIKNNYNIEKYILQFYNFNSDFYKKLPSDINNKIFKVFKDISEKIKKTKFIEILFRNKNDILKNVYSKMDFEEVLKNMMKENDFNKVKDKINELKGIKEMNFFRFFDCLSKFYDILIEGVYL